MKNRQEAQITMFRAVETHCNDNSSIIAAVPAFQTAFNEFKTKLAEILAVVQLRDASLAGITAGKNHLKEALSRQTADIAGIIYAYAATTNNEPLKAETNLSYSKLLQTRDDELAPRCQNIHARADENKTELADYGITAATLTALQTAIDNYKTETPKTRTAQSRRKTQTANLDHLIKDATGILKTRMDKLVANFKTAHPDFVAAYEANRIIIDPATTTTQLKGKVTAKNTGDPVKNATVTVVETNTTAKTDSSGEYQIKPLSPNTYTIRVTATGFQDFEQDEVEVKLGAVNKLDVELSL